MSEAELTVENAVRHFAPHLTLGDKLAARLGANVETRSVRAVDGVTLRVAKGETLGIVGESGCGKSTLGRMMAGIMAPTSGTVRLKGEPVMVNGRKATTTIQTVFQDPFASLDPRMRVGDTILEGPLAHGLVRPRDKGEALARALTEVGLDPSLSARFPHQFSGGQRQRIAIARALAMQPEVLICDEPVASLDVSIQAQIINLFLELRQRLGLTIVFISHDLAVVRHLADRVAVMYLGRVVEEGPIGDVYDAPKHPYTRGLLESVPKIALDDGGRVDIRPIRGEIPSPLSPPPGCNFNPRCPIAVERCRRDDPALRPLGPARAAACHLAEPVAAGDTVAAIS
ncbi:ABC transporter ATP-binding protein [Acuticoccus sediminis]|uniref:ABC transporter ATP-binding protein n=1 Tax=Acuticoccus sediminis TaxID=2184697 RepID=UPI001CFE71B1|nr:oligopeptide/dipeptide ABC transporter ATP-binding protein [Acuticoccus sediminis]